MKKFLYFFILFSMGFVDLKIKQINEKNQGIDINANVPGYQHKDGLWFEKNKHDTYYGLAIYLYEKFIKINNFKKILELGSGAGSLAYFLRQIDPALIIVTVDGNKETYKSPYINFNHHFIARTDENLEFVDENKNRIIFDFVISFEHFEHIQHKNFHVLLDNIKKHVNHKSLCFCSAANWGGPGVYEPHCNVKTFNAWKNYLSSQDFEMLDTKNLKDMPAPFNFNWNASYKLLFRISTKGE